ncbi:MAG: family 10 glycosylhydrolase [Oscillospiraceae bacterium]|nr:family 10 glycosylhydrolase [Oscillospiraceae bacterium]
MKNLFLIVALSVFLTACSDFQTAEKIETTTVSPENLSLQYESPIEYPRKNLQETSKEENNIINYTIQNGTWFTYMELSDMLANTTEENFKSDIKEHFENAKNQGINTVYVQVRAFCDAYYNSQIFEKAYNNDFDPLAIMVETAHSLNLSCHAWINPLRGKSEINVEAMKEYFENVNGRYYLNPVYEEVRNFICNGVGEIIENYNVDGIQIDDYFYPTTDESFDISEYDGIYELSDWRRENINKLVSGIYSTIKNKDENLRFCISPQGNIYNDYNVLYADVEKWCTEKGYCDYIIPQLYYGFKNQVCPFEPTLQKWIDLTSNGCVSLSAGICTYKVGKEDTFAGSGKNEWIEDKDIPERQIEIIKSKNIGFSIYD